MDDRDKERGSRKEFREEHFIFSRRFSLPVSLHGFTSDSCEERLQAETQNVDFTQTLCEILGIPRSSLLGI